MSVIISLVLASAVQSQWQQVEETDIRGHTMYSVFRPGEVPAIFEPTFVSVADADDYYYPNELLIVMVDGSEVHAYSTWHLEDHIVVNDVLGDRTITATW